MLGIGCQDGVILAPAFGLASRFPTDVAMSAVPSTELPGADLHGAHRRCQCRLRDADWKPADVLHSSGRRVPGELPAEPIRVALCREGA